MRADVIATAIACIVQRSRVRLRKMKGLARGKPARRWQGQNSHPGVASPGSTSQPLGHWDPLPITFDYKWEGVPSPAYWG